MEQSFGKYQVKKELGRGAMGIVYLAVDTVLEREVAIKTISSTIREGHLKERFIREARAAGKLCHNNIVTIYDFGVEEDRLFIAMEYLEGRDLYQLISEEIPMDIKDKLEIVRQICMGLDYAHQHEVFHRDIKPANIRVLGDGTVKIVDFGLAVIQSSSLTQTGSFLGTPNYTAPERLKGESGDGLSDQFAVGILLYELLTYCRAFEGDSISTVIYNVLHKEPRPLDSKMTAKFPEIEAIIRKAIIKDPKLRYPSMKEMAADIESLLQKMKKRRYSMTETIAVMEEQMEMPQKDPVAEELTAITDYAGIKRKKTPLKAAALIAIPLIVAALVYFFILKPGTAAVKPGFLAFDVKPYAVIREVIDIETGEIVPIPEDAATPIRLTLQPGTYRIEYSHPGWNGKNRVKEVTVTTGQTLRETDNIDDGFVEKAVEHFSVPVPGGKEGKKRGNDGG
ncbi:MAG: protein kinase [bacterium]|nr:protein kinase [bacterium]